MDSIDSEHPFVPPPRDEAPREVPGDAPEGSYTYEMVPVGPAVAAAEVETRRVSVEVKILWGRTALHVAHLTPPRSFHVGEAARDGAPHDFILPSSMLGAAPTPIVLVSKEGAVSAVLPRGARGTIELADQPAIPVQQAIEGGVTQPCSALPEGRSVALSIGSKAKVEVAGFTFEVSVGHAARAVAKAPLVSTRSLLYTGLSATLHLALVAACALFIAPPAEDEYGLNQEQRQTISRILATADEKESERREAALAESDEGDEGDEGASGTRTRCEEGTMGNPSSWSSNHMPYVEPIEYSDPTRAAALRDAAEFAMITLRVNPGETAWPFSQNDSVFQDMSSPRSDYWNEAPDPFRIMPQSRLWGVGEEDRQAGGLALGLSWLSVLGPTPRTTPYFGLAPAPPGSFRARPAKVSDGAASVSGRLSPAVIQRVLRRQLGRVRLCYEHGLRLNPALQGRINVRFVIGRDGAISSVGNAGSDLPDSGLVSCIVRSYYGLSFPRPEGGIVSAVYPISLSPGI